MHVRLGPRAPAAPARTARAGAAFAATDAARLRALEDRAGPPPRSATAGATPRPPKATPSRWRGRRSSTAGWPEYPWTLLEASGEAVGLPAGVMGNSEVGHLTLGAGRMVPQDLLRIDLALRDGSFFDEPRALVGRRPRAQAQGATLHLMGLLSDGGVHSHERHLAGLLELAAPRGRAPRARPRVHRRPRHAAEVGAAATSRRLEAALAGVGRTDRDGVAAATTPWIATSAGTAWRAPTRRWSSPRACTRRARRGRGRGGLRPRRDRRVRPADRSRGRRRAASGRSGTATRSSSSTSGPTARGRSRAR